MGQIFIVPFHVKRTENSIMPNGAIGAYVSCYAEAADYAQAIQKCIAALELDGMRIEDIMQPIHSMEVSQWSQHVCDQWPEQVNQLPNQKEFEDAVRAGKVMYGPFGAY